MMRLQVLALLLVTVDALRSLASVTDAALPENYTAYLHAFDLLERRMNDPAHLRRVREEVFWRRHALASEQNAKPDRRWRAAASHLFDATDDEMHAMMGYKPRAAPHHHEGINFLATNGEALNLSMPEVKPVLPEGMDWRKHVTYSNIVRSQGQCGSCWAISSTNALEMHLELAGFKGGPLALDEVVTCTPNARHCGGQGGCQGATAELAFQFVKDKGLSFEDDLDGQGSLATSCEAPAPSMGRRLVSSGFVRLTPNKALPLQYALAVKGPVVVSADATGWEGYGSGVFDACPLNAAVNHAVLAVGYGTSPEGKYWTIRNSWGSKWGEDGHIRILRHDHDDHCGTDYHPQEGVACDGETEPVPVCGMCGILFDSSFPVGVAVSKPTPPRAMKLRTSSALAA